MRIASATSGVLVGLYLASLSNGGGRLDAGLVGTLGAASFAAELVLSIPAGIASDRLARRWVMASGTVAGACGAALFGIAGTAPMYFLSRTLEGISAAAVVPALLAYLADATEHRAALRARTMSYFELSLLAGLALGGLVAAQLFRAVHAGAFALVAAAYLASGAVLLAAVSDAPRRTLARPIADLRDVLRLPSVRHLAPVWLCVNGVVGLWLGPTLPFLLTRRSGTGQYLAGIYAVDPARVGWLLFGYAVVFGAGVTAWSFVLPHVRLNLVLAIALVAMLAASACIYVLNHSADQPPPLRWVIGGMTALVVMVESGFTPAALAWLAERLPLRSGRGAAMGIYSVLLTVGAILGTLLAAVLGHLASIDGLLLGTALLGGFALILLRRVPDRRSVARGSAP